MNKESIIQYFEFFINNDPACAGVERLLSKNGRAEVFERLKDDEKLNLNKVQLNQLFTISGLPSMTFGFFKYYWLTLPTKHPYDLTKLELGDNELKENGDELLTTKGGYETDGIEKYFFDENHLPKTFSVINSLEHLRWGLLRIYTDALLYFGNITLGYSILSAMKEKRLTDFFESQSFKSETIKARGHCLSFSEIEENDRYLISEAVCKNLDGDNITETALRRKLMERFSEARANGIERIEIGNLLDKNVNLKQFGKGEKKVNKDQLTLEDLISTTEFIEQIVSSEDEIDKLVTPLYDRFKKARREALHNTKLYLSLLDDMDVYVATSMRGKDDFMTMAKNCREIFSGSPPSVKDLNLRYFDPTISAAEGHDDKGVTECLMVKCAKVLIYSSGNKDSYGKDAEAAMALSSGKPVIFYCPDEIRYNVSKNIHPLTKLIDFKTGVANGAMIARNLQEVRTLLLRLFNNEMRFMLTSNRVSVETESENTEKTYFKLKDTQTASTIRIQTSDLFLSKSFWNYFYRHVKQ